MCAEPSLEGRVWGAATIEDDIGPCQRRPVVLREVTVLVIVGDFGNQFLAESGLTGRDESDLLSQSAVGDSGVAQPHQFLDVFSDGSPGPQGGVEAIEAAP